MTNNEIRRKFETKTESNYNEIFSLEDTEIFMNKARKDERERVIKKIKEIMENSLIGIGTTDNQAHWYNDGIRDVWKKIKSLE